MIIKHCSFDLFIASKSRQTTRVYMFGKMFEITVQVTNRKQSNMGFVECRISSIYTPVKKTRRIIGASRGCCLRSLTQKNIRAGFAKLGLKYMRHPISFDFKPHRHWF